MRSLYIIDPAVSDLDIRRRTEIHGKDRNPWRKTEIHGEGPGFTEKDSGPRQEK